MHVSFTDADADDDHHHDFKLILKIDGLYYFSKTPFAYCSAEGFEQCQESMWERTYWLIS